MIGLQTARSFNGGQHSDQQHIRTRDQKTPWNWTVA